MAVLYVCQNVLKCGCNMLDYVFLYVKTHARVRLYWCPWIPACVNEASQQHTRTHSFRSQTPRETRAGTAATVMVRSLQERGKRRGQRGRERGKEGGGLGIMRGCTRTDEEVDEEERWSEVNLIYFMDIHECANTKERNAWASISDDNIRLPESLLLALSPYMRSLK